MLPSYSKSYGSHGGGAKGESARKRPRRAAEDTLSDAAEDFSVALYERSKRLTIAHYFVDVLANRKSNRVVTMGPFLFFS